MFLKTVISFLLLLMFVPVAPAASTVMRPDIAVFCQGGSNYEQNGRFHCLLDSQNAPINVFASRRPGSDETSVATYSYDAWGRMRDPQTLIQYASGSQPSLLLGRGYCGHEHLSYFGLINMNARLYDPVMGRFLSPDPYVQAPDFSQNFNRYAYALNNPLKYTDSLGQFFVLDSFLIGWIGGDLDRAKQMAWNDIKIWGGLFNVDKNRKGGGIIEFISRFTWQLPQTIFGFIAAHSMNTFHLAGGVDSVEYLHGATVLQGHKNGWGAVTLGSFIMGDCDIEAKDDDELFQHEFGHYLQSQSHGLLWTFDYGIPSLIDSMINDYDKHNEFYTEQDANARSLRYFAKQYGGDKAIGLWQFDDNKIIGFDNNKDYYSLSNQVALSKAILFYSRIETKQTTNTGFPQIVEDEETIPFIF